MPLFGPNGDIISPVEVSRLHMYDDLDAGALAHHHTLGNRQNQAAPGNHNHDADYAALSIQTALEKTMTAFTPSFGNVTSGAGVGYFKLIAPYLCFVRLAGSSGTATAAAVVTCALPPGITVDSIGVQRTACTGGGGGLIATASVGSGGFSFNRDYATAAWTAGESIAGLRCNFLFVCQQATI